MNAAKNNKPTSTSNKSWVTPEELEQFPEKITRQVKLTDLEKRYVDLWNNKFYSFEAIAKEFDFLNPDGKPNRNRAAGMRNTILRKGEIMLGKTSRKILLEGKERKLIDEYRERFKDKATANTWFKQNQSEVPDEAMQLYILGFRFYAKAGDFRTERAKPTKANDTAQKALAETAEKARLETEALKGTRTSIVEIVHARAADLTRLEAEEKVRQEIENREIRANARRVSVEKSHAKYMTAKREAAEQARIAAEAERKRLEEEARAAVAEKARLETEAKGKTQRDAIAAAAKARAEREAPQDKKNHKTGVAVVRNLSDLNRGASPQDKWDRTVPLPAEQADPVVDGVSMQVRRAIAELVGKKSDPAILETSDPAILKKTVEDFCEAKNITPGYGRGRPAQQLIRMLAAYKNG